ncbi:IclR family transcriptional regulator domain-containing protein [Devosia sp. A449]
MAPPQPHTPALGGYATSLGLVLLSGQSRDAQEQYLARGPFKRYTSRTNFDPIELVALLGKARLDGYATVQDQLEYGVIAVAVPVMDRAGHVVAAINCSALSERVDSETLIRTRVPALQAASRQISQALDRHPALVHSVLSSVNA